MKKSNLIALIIIIVALVSIIGVYYVTTYGPLSERAQIKKRVEYVMESYGAENDGKSTWSTYSPDGSDLKTDLSYTALCVQFERGEYDTEEEAHANLLTGVVFDIDSVEKKDGLYVVTVNLDLPNETADRVCYFVFEKVSGDWVLDKQCIEQAIYAGNGIGGSTGVITDIFDQLAGK